MRKSTILVTGVAGFIGSNLARRLLAEGHRVAGLDNLSYGVKSQIPSGVDFQPGDVRDRKIRKRFRHVDACFHLAAKNCIADCQKDPAETAEINVSGTANVLEACREAGVGKVILAESSALYEGSSVYPTPEKESSPVSFYALSKAAQRAFTLAYRDFHGLNFTALRYFNVYGPRQDYRRTIPPVMSAFIIHLLERKRPVIYGTGGKKRDFIYVEDVNDFHLLCLRDRRTDGQTYNLGSGTSATILGVYRKIAKLLGSDIQPLFKKDLPGEAGRTLADIRKAKGLGWRPRTGIEEGLRLSIDYIRREVAG